MDLELTPAEVEQFQKALLSAFPNRGNLVQLVYFRLEQDLDQLVPSGTYANDVTRLIRWANAQGKSWALLSAAHGEVPGNPKLHAFYLQIQAGRTPPPGSDVPDALIDDLISGLLTLSHLLEFGGRTNLLAGLPGTATFTRDEGSARNDLTGIVAQLQARGRLSSGEWPLLKLVDNALDFAEGYESGDRLAKVRESLVRHYQEV